LYVNKLSKNEEVKLKGFIYKDIKRLCKEYGRHIEDFSYFMRGQTVCAWKDGFSAFYYLKDVNKFFKMNLEEQARELEEKEDEGN